jgi:GTP pyrophosphokinase
MKKNLNIWPYIELSQHLVRKQRRGFGNMFRHQVETFAILLEHGYKDAVILKASLIHDLLEDGHKVGFTCFEDIITTDQDGQQVFDLVKELSIRVHDGIEEPKEMFLQRIMLHGSKQAKLVKLADRLSNINTLFATNDRAFIKKYILETRQYIMPYAEAIDNKMARELEFSLSKLESIT